MKRSTDYIMGVIGMLTVALLTVAGPIALVVLGFLFVFGAFIWVPALIIFLAYFTARALLIDIWVRIRTLALPLLGRD